MAKAKYLPSPELIASDLLIAIRPRAEVWYQGSAEQLRAEGLIPEGFAWPKGREMVYWMAGGFDLTVERCRPPGTKSPMRQWASGDWWLLVRSPIGCRGQGPGPTLIYEKQRELEYELWRESAAGHAMFRRWWDAHRDDAFQSFKRQLLGLPQVPIRRAA